MHSIALFERTDGYLHSQFRDSRAPWGTRADARPFVTLSRQAGSGGSSLARLLARKLNADSSTDVVWRLYEENLMPQILEANHLSRRMARFLPEDRVTEPAATIGELVGLHPNLWELMQKTRGSLHDLARRGHCILVGRGGNFATADLRGGVHVRLVASADHRARYLAKRYNISEIEARVRNARCEAARNRYVRANYNEDATNPGAYDLVINTERVSLDDAADIIIERVRALADSPA